MGQREASGVETDLERAGTQRVLQTGRVVNARLLHHTAHELTSAGLEALQTVDAEDALLDVLRLVLLDAKVLRDQLSRVDE